MSTRQMGHFLLMASHWSTHSWWKRCIQGRRLEEKGGSEDWWKGRGSRGCQGRHDTGYHRMGVGGGPHWHHWEMAQRGSWEPCPAVRLWQGWEVMTGRSTPQPSSSMKPLQTSLKQSHDFVLHPSKPNITLFSYTLGPPVHITSITHLEHSTHHVPRRTT